MGRALGALSCALLLGQSDLIAASLPRVELNEHSLPYPDVDIIMSWTYRSSYCHYKASCCPLNIRVQSSRVESLICCRYVWRNDCCKATFLNEQCSGNSKPLHLCPRRCAAAHMQIHLSAHARMQVHGYQCEYRCLLVLMNLTSSTGTVCVQCAGAE